MRNFGALLSFILFFTKLLIGPMQKFSFANSIIKKLYSTQEEPGKEDALDEKYTEVI